MRFEEFRRKLLERIDSEGCIIEDYILRVNNREVNRIQHSYFITVYYSNTYEHDNIQSHDLDEYQIEWFVLEKEDE